MIEHLDREGNKMEYVTCRHPRNEYDTSDCQSCREINNWMATAEQTQRNVDYYRNLVVTIGDMLGPVARTTQSGYLCTEVLCAAVPDAVFALIAENRRLKNELANKP